MLFIPGSISNLNQILGVLKTIDGYESVALNKMVSAT